jgi:hypothetical protein
MGQYNVRTNRVEDDMLRRLVDEKGYRLQEIFRGNLRDLYHKEFPPYNQSKKNTAPDPLSELSPADYCTRVVGGKVEGKYCVIGDGPAKTKVPLDIIKEY